MAFDIEDIDTASSGPNPLRSLHVLTFQGHPEFDREIVENIIEVRTQMGIVTGELRERSLENAKKPHDGLKLGRAILAMLGVKRLGRIPGIAWSMFSSSPFSIYTGRDLDSCATQGKLD